MRVPTNDRQRGLQFNITPLIDVVFLLVIFFLVASHFARTEPNETVELPSASETTDDDEARQLVVTVLQDGTYSVAGQTVSMNEIENMIADGADVDAENYSVRIRGDRRVSFQHVKPIMLTCPKYGVSKFGFRTIEREGT